MTAAVYGGDGSITVEALPVPPARAGEALIEVSHCGICGTDLHLVLEQYARPGSVLGHEWSGTVASVGEGVSESLLGARVVVGPTTGCGDCRACRRGRPSVCLHRSPPDYLSSRGAFCQYVVAEAERLIPVPASLSLRVAALTEPTAIALHTCNLSGVTPDDRVLITGAGPVGQLILAVPRTRGVTDITVSEPAPARRARALALGVARVVEPDELQQPPMGRPVDRPYTIAFECSGNARAAECALGQLDKAGTLVFVGTGREHPRIDHNRVIVLELSVIGAYNYDVNGFADALALLASDRLPIDQLIEAGDVSLDDLLPTMRRLASGELAGKAMVSPAPR
jgi:2-desacetyl-2-hydroxyethyl bacteriochlorophyllide A dehydrogenase